MPKIYLGTGGYSDTDLIGTLYPHGTSKTDFLNIYSRHYDTIEINSTFHAPIGGKALQGMVEKAEDRLKFSVKLHQDFSHQRTGKRSTSKAVFKCVTAFNRTKLLGESVYSISAYF